MIRRTIVESTIKCAKVVDGVVEAVGEIVVNDTKVAENKAYVLAIKKYGLGVVVTNIEYAENVYEISKEDFMKYAKKVEG